MNIGFDGGEDVHQRRDHERPAARAVEDNGGPTETMMPGAGSPAIGKGTGCPATDQRGDPRGAACTLGAVERG